MCGDDADRPGSPKSLPATGKKKNYWHPFRLVFFSSSSASSSSVRRIFYFWIFWKFQIMMGDVARRTLPNDATGRFCPCSWPGSSIFHIDKTFSLPLQYTKSFLILIFFFFLLFFLLFIVVPHGRVGFAFTRRFISGIMRIQFRRFTAGRREKKKNPVKWVSDSLKMMTVLD